MTTAHSAPDCYKPKALWSVFHISLSDRNDSTNNNLATAEKCERAGPLDDINRRAGAAVTVRTGHGLDRAERVVSTISTSSTLVLSIPCWLRKGNYQKCSRPRH